MNKKEAMERYSILIPTDFNNYDKERYRDFDNMYLESFYSTFFEPDHKKNKQDNNKEKTAIVLAGQLRKNAVVLGGQAGAGKSSLVADAKRKFNSEGRRIVVIDDDEYRKFYPYAEEILENCPEFYTEITATATNIITPKILKFASENGYNFIFDGTMKNARIVNTMKTWEGYNISVHVMAACGERSLISTAIRNGELRQTMNEGRLVEQQNHWDMYEGLPKTLEYIHKEEQGLVEEIKIFTRSNNPLYPKEEYSSFDSKGKTPTQALEELREKDRIKFFKEAANDDIECLKKLIQNLSPKEQSEANEVINFIEKRRSEITVNDDNDEQYK